jgi:hypothetical protein
MKQLVQKFFATDSNGTEAPWENIVKDENTPF